jgi:hypothetical protein
MQIDPESGGRADYDREVRGWLKIRAPQLDGVPIHMCQIVPDDSGENIEFEEFDQDGDICGGQREERYEFGSADEVVAGLMDRAKEDPWVQEVCAALARERRWPNGWLRRSTLEIFKGSDDMFHVTAVANRSSILRYGLDWTRMGDAPGITGSRRFELPVIFACDSREESESFMRIAKFPSDIWAIRVGGLWIENGPDGWWILAHSVEPSRLSVVGSDTLLKRAHQHTPSKYPKHRKKT